MATPAGPAALCLASFRYERRLLAPVGSTPTVGEARCGAGAQGFRRYFFCFARRPIRMRSVTVVFGRRLAAGLGRNRPVIASRTALLVFFFAITGVWQTSLRSRCLNSLVGMTGRSESVTAQAGGRS